MKTTSEGGLTVTLLGTGTSTGVPVIGCTCRVCTSDDPRDKRRRCSAVVRAGGIHLVIDTGPDFRAQALEHPFGRVDAVLYTHHHFDHVAGLDDLRPYFYRNRRAIPCYAKPETAQVLRQSFPYIFEDGTYPGVVKLELHEVEAPFTVEDRYDADAPSVLVTPLDVRHGRLDIHGYRIGDFAYLTDTSFIPESTFEKLIGIDTLVLSALRPEPHPMHFTVREAIEAAERIGARQTYFIHMTHNLLHAETNAELPAGIALGYDGLTFETLGE
ncbi:MAG: MBL fold metallo-hydrolase [Bacteroidota bacterium]